MTNRPEELLSSTRDLTRRVRLAQRAAWFPLLVFAAVTVVAIPFNRYGPHPIHCGAVRRPGDVCIAYPTLALWYWPIAVVVAYLAITWFYRRRSEGRGVGTRVLPYAAAGAILAVLTGAWALWANTHPAFLAGTLRLAPGGPPSRVLYRVASPACAIGLALLLLAWIERSWPLLALTAAYLVVAVATVGLGRFSHPTPWAFLPHLAIDAGVLLVGGTLLAVLQRPLAPRSL